MRIPETDFAHPPHGTLLVWIQSDDGGVAEVLTRQRSGERIELLGQFSRRVAVKFDEEERTGGALDALHQRCVARMLPTTIDDGCVDKLDGGRMATVGDDRGLGRLDDGVEVNDGKSLAGGKGCETDGRLGDDGESTFRSDDQWSEVGGILK